jgi:hypothetical protein
MPLTEDTLVYAIWFISDVQGWDWLAYLVRPAPGKPWKFAYRFRYHVDDKIHDSEDWFDVTAGPADSEDKPPAKMIAAATTAAVELTKASGGKLHTLNIQGNGLDAMEKLAKQPWCSVRAEKAERPS